MFDFGAVGERNGAGLVELGKRDVSLGIGVDQRHERPALSAPLSHVDLVVAEQNFGVDDRAAIRADAARQLVEHVIGIGSRVAGAAFLDGL